MATTSSPPGSRSILLLSTALVVVGLFVAREFLVPLALAALISFLLAPLTRGLERWHFGRIGSVLAATTLAFGVLGFVGYVAAGQLIDLANQLPEYRSNLLAKVTSLKTQPNSPVGRVTQTVRELTEEIAREEPLAKPPGQPGVAPAPVPVAVVATPGTAFETFARVLAPVVGPLGTAAIVIVFVVFMLLQREDLRDRVIHLVGRGRLHVTTQALDEAGERVSRYLLAQLIVNVTYGIPIGLGLWFIGIPNAILWGCLATVLRFVPYVGPVLATAFPLVLALAISPSWNAPLLVVALFVIVELISNNVVEPWLYGSSTGLSPMAIIVSAVFWTWLWGAMGLILATPLTVCIAVIGKHIPALKFLDVLLGDKPPIAAADRFYQRLLAMDGEEALALCEAEVERVGLAAAFDQLIVPTLRQAERDHRDGALSPESRREMCLVARELIGELGDVPAAPEGVARVLCVPANNEVDELGALMLSRLLANAGVVARVLPAKLMSGELVEEIAAAAPAFVCVSALSAGSVMPATQLSRKVRERVSTLLAVGVWGTSDDDEERRLQRVKRAQADQIFSTLAQAASEIRAQPALAVAAAAPRESAA